MYIQTRCVLMLYMLLNQWVLGVSDHCVHFPMLQCGTWENILLTDSDFWGPKKAALLRVEHCCMHRSVYISPDWGYSQQRSGKM
jgi:hypothetical protein